MEILIDRSARVNLSTIVIRRQCDISSIFHFQITQSLYVSASPRICRGWWLRVARKQRLWRRMKSISLRSTNCRVHVGEEQLTSGPRRGLDSSL